jgi:hypothetical protein
VRRGLRGVRGGTKARGKDWVKIMIKIDDEGLSDEIKELIRAIGIWARQEDREGALPAEGKLSLKVARVWCPEKLRRKFR